MKVLSAVVSLVVGAVLSWSSVPAAQEPERFLPYGLRVPPGAEIAFSPQPFSKAVHGLPMPNGSPERDVARRPHVRLPVRHQRLAVDQSYTPTFEPGSGDRGLWLTAGTGIYASNDVALDLTIPDAAIGTTIYAPTHMAPGGTCMETVTAHWRYDGMGDTAHGHGFWDWCQTDGEGGWQLFEFMDQQWTDRYVRRRQGRQRYWTQVINDGPASWQGLLYNFLEGRWEEKVRISGESVSGFGTTGWTMWESHHLMDVAQVCPPFPDIQASDLRVFENGLWTLLSVSNSDNSLGPYGQCWLDGTYTFRLANKRDRWQARTSR